ncbi:uncharacterized protein LOC133916900 isoform X2 [Phragmites australis]|uniref:uncharacterized protein LOC133916900 isoform X2 n=1 Tax=Phragmites australis TaxID=29695 RepID=UPI002D77807B|nr:uncharacterized protein LOC133916900 isoform X2 [Phragmites australis]
MADSAALPTAASSSSLPRSLVSRPPLSSPLHGRSRAPRRCRFGSRSLHRLRARAGKDDPEDLYGPYPWDQPLDLTTDFDIQWVQEDKVTLFTSEGLIQIGGSLVPRRVSASQKRQRKVKGTQMLRRFQESSYMDPNQSLCLGALFNIAATNVNIYCCLFSYHVFISLVIYYHFISQGLDMGRRLCIFGFCRSVEMLSDVVEDTVLEHGGEVVTAEKASNDGLQEKLTMSVAVPLLWGVPPAAETLHVAVRSGGGIVDKIYWQWDLF